MLLILDVAVGRRGGSHRKPGPHSSSHKHPPTSLTITHARMHACTLICTDPFTHTHMHSHVSTPVYTYAQIHTSSHHHTCTCMHASSHHHTCTLSCTCTCSGMDLHTQRHKYMHRDAPPHTRSHMCMPEHTDVHTCMLTLSHMDTRVHVSLLHTRTHVCECVCILTFINTHKSILGLVFCFYTRRLLHMLNNGAHAETLASIRGLGS